MCGKFVKNTVIPAHKTSVDVSTELDDKLKEQLNSILNSTISEHDIEPFRHSKKLYRACVNQGNKIVFFFIVCEIHHFFVLITRADTKARLAADKRAPRCYRRLSGGRRKKLAGKQVVLAESSP